MKKITNTIIMTVFGALLFTAIAISAENKTDNKNESEKKDTENLSPQAKQQKLLHELDAQLSSYYKQKNYLEAEKTLGKIIKIAGESGQLLYNLACLQNLQDKSDEAVKTLKKAVDKGFSQISHMQTDPDLASLRDRKDFKKIITDAPKKADQAAAARRKARKKLPYDKGGKIKGVKTVEGDPENGLRYRLRMSPKASKEKPQRLLIWLHPSGGRPMNDTIEKLAPFLNKKGFALLVMTQKQFDSWTTDELNDLMGGTLNHVAKTEGVNVKRPILMGYSAGGQIAMIAYVNRPEIIGGIVLHGAFPILPKDGAVGQWKPMKTPKGEEIKKIPILAFYGSTEQPGHVWRSESPKWRKAGVPLEVHEIPNAGHWLHIDKKNLQVFGKWLDAVAKGELPGKKNKTAK